jgi:hypothetical protein
MVLLVVRYTAVQSQSSPRDGVQYVIRLACLAEKPAGLHMLFLPSSCSHALSLLPCFVPVACLLLVLLQHAERCSALKLD